MLVINTAEDTLLVIFRMKTLHGGASEEASRGGCFLGHGVLMKVWQGFILF